MLPITKNLEKGYFNSGKKEDPNRYMEVQETFIRHGLAGFEDKTKLFRQGKKNTKNKITDNDLPMMIYLHTLIVSSNMTLGYNHIFA